MTLFYYQEQVTTRRLNFYGLEHHPDAVRFEHIQDGKVINAGFLPKKKIDRLIDRLMADKEDLFVWLDLPHRSGVSLPENAVYWLVPSDLLFKNRNLSDYRTSDYLPRNAPGYTLIHESEEDGRIWDINGNQILAPMTFMIDGLKFDLEAMSQHFKESPDVMSFRIQKNTSWPDIQGSTLGLLVLDLRNIPFPKDAELTQTWIHNNLFDSHMDLLDISQFCLPREVPYFPSGIRFNHGY